ncbi:ion channel [Siminovitchia fortis]|uniref:Two pore domain potassium channel family protein n=2 Tax=Siminovitchia fortis TaxID=254758 RepID=A0A443IU41_9BACI|nr:ion channel [Siminovitchia fortis]RWR11224.1 two pore domain potassium channel family protein [Siminovitchia fortis]WHY80360.1 ion channel [Siminovitchia fortis]
MWHVLFLGVLICITMALRLLFFPARFKYKEVSFENFVFLGITYAVIMIGFGILYLLLDMRGLYVFNDVEMNAYASSDFLAKFGTSIYLSAVTLFSVGFGDVAPVGIGRLLAIIEALLGYTIPAAFVVRTFIDFDPSSRK